MTTAGDAVGDAEQDWGSVLNLRDEHQRHVAVESLKASEAMLRTREAQLRSFLQHSRDLLAVVALDGTIQWVSDTAREMLLREPDDLVGRSAFEVVHPDHIDLAIESFGRVVGGETMEPMTLQVVRGDGTTLDVEGVGEVVSDDAGKPERLVLNIRDVSWRQAAEQARQRSEARFRALVQNSTDAVIVLRPDGSFGYVSPKARHLFAWPDEDELPEATLDLLEQHDAEELAAAVGQLLAHPDEPLVREMVAVNADGEARHLEVVATNQVDNEAVGGIVANIRDITDRREAEDARRRSESRFATVMQHTFDVTALLDREGVIQWVTPNSVRLLGWSPEDVIGTSGLDLVHPDDAGLMATELVSFVAGEGVPNPTLVRLKHRDGSWRDIEIVGTSFLDNPDVDAIAVHLRDVRERVAAERRLEHAATHDPLTELPNRTLLLDRLAHALARSRRSHSTLAVLFCDLDHFKVVNDSLGHSRGDEVLCLVAERFKAPLRPGDTVSRFGGDEFVILCEDLASIEDALIIADRVIDSLRQVVPIDGHDVYVGASIGVAVAHAGDADPESLIRDADSAMYRAKARGRGCHQLFESDMWEEALDRFALENALRRALERRELEVHYQPIVSLDHPNQPMGALVGVEALVRWNHPDRGRLAPSEFIGLAEEIGVIGPIGSWVLTEACTQLGHWDEAFGGDCGLSIAVNLSGRQLDDPDLVDQVADALASCGVKPQRLSLEITESMLMRDVQVSETALAQIKELGVTLSVDDFGTGYSSMSYLRRFPVDVLKVDRSFVDGVGSEPEDSAIVAAIVNLAHTLGLSAVGEGVETEAQLEALRRLGCDQAQGFLLHRPVPASEIDELLTTTAAGA